MSIDWSKAPADATHHFAGDNKYAAHWLKEGFFCVVGIEVLGWQPGHLKVPRSVYTARPTASWNGEALPPVGSEVTVVEGPCSFEGDLINWLNTRVKVASAFKNALGQDILAVENSSGECACFIAECLQPSRTPEQIAAEERSKACDKMFGVLLSLPEDRKHNRSSIVEALYDAGYRKVEGEKVYEIPESGL